MSQPSKVAERYERAMRRDGAREQLPPGSVWGLIDFIPEVLDSRLRKRGGYTYASENIAAITASSAAATWIKSGIVAEYTAGLSVLAFDEDGRVWEIESTTASENIGEAVVGRNPLFYNDMVIVLGDGTSTIKKVTRSGGTHTIANLGGSPAAFKYGLIYKDVMWGGAVAASARRTFFSVAGNPESWDLTNKYIDVSYPVTGYGALANAVMIFSAQRTARVRGSIPPPDTDFTVDDPVFNVGCTDNKSIANWRDKLIFANAQGLFFTDGVAVEDLTKISGMKSWWRDVMAGREGFATGSAYAIDSWTIAGGVFDDYYIYSIMNGTTMVDSGMIDLNRFAWMRLRNIDAAFFWPQLYPQELYFGRRNAARVGKMSDIFVPSATNKADADGTAVLPEIELPFIEGAPGKKTLKNLYVAYDLRDAASDDPALTVSMIDSPEETSYVAVSPTLPETTTYTRAKLEVAKEVPGFGLKIVQTGASSDTRLYTVEADVSPREPSKHDR